jgi:hypothetical protein
VLSIDGRLLIFANRFPLTKRAAHDQAMEAGTIKAALRANYTIVAHRKQGGMGSVLRLKFGDDLQVIARRWPILFRLFELVPVWVPIYILLGSALNVFALVADFFDRKGATAISSLTVAAKGPNAAD